MPNALNELIDFEETTSLPAFGWFASPDSVTLQFADDDEGDDEDEDEDEESKKKDEGFSPSPIDVLLYTGEPVQKYGVRMVISLDGMTVPSRQIPILSAHNHGVPIGYADKVSKEPALRMQGKVFDARDERLAAPTREAVQGMRGAAEQGFNWQASMGISFQKVLHLPDGESMKVNGQDFDGPGYVVAESTLLEGSVLALGADGNTKSTLLSLSAERGTVPVTFREKAPEQPQPKESAMSVIALSAFLAAFPDHQGWAANYYAEQQDAGTEFSIASAKAVLCDKLLADNAALRSEAQEKQSRLEVLASVGVTEDEAPGFSGSDEGSSPMEFAPGDYHFEEFLQDPDLIENTNTLLTPEFRALPRMAQKAFGSVDAYRLYKVAEANGRLDIRREPAGA